MAKVYLPIFTHFTHFHPFYPFDPFLPFLPFLQMWQTFPTRHPLLAGVLGNTPPLESHLTPWTMHIHNIYTLYIQCIYTTYIECGRHTQRDTRDWQGFLETPLPSNRTSLPQLRTSNPTLESPHACHRMRQMAKWQKWVKWVKWVKMGKMGKCHMSHCVLPFLPFFAIFAISSNMPMFYDISRIVSSDNWHTAVHPHEPTRHYAKHSLVICSCIQMGARRHACHMVARNVPVHPLSCNLTYDMKTPSQNGKNGKNG